MESDARHYALLIGINAYPESSEDDRSSPLRGCVNDVLGIQDILQHQSPRVEIKTLTATADADNNVIESEQDRPTFTNVQKALQDLVDKTKEGDCVYIHYSGHGSHSRQPSSTDDERETNGYQGDLCLCLLGDMPSKEVINYPCRLLVAKLHELVGKTQRKATVTLVLDCCFSARMLRTHRNHEQMPQTRPMIRYLAQDASAEYYGDYMSSRYRNVDMSPSWLINPDGYTILVACAPHEVAAEVRVSETYYGKLSYHLLEILKKIGFKSEQRKVYHHLQAQLFYQGNDGPLPLPQTPVLYGNKGQTFLGKSSSTSLTVNETGKLPMYAKRSGDELPLVLLAGEAHGFCSGDRLRLLPSTEASDTSTATEASAVATIVKTYTVTSILNVEGVDVLGAGIWVAEPLSRLRLRDFPVYVDPSVSQLRLENLNEVLAQHSLQVHEDARQPWVFRVSLEEKQDEESCFVIHNSSGDKIHNIPPLLLHGIDATELAAPLAHLARYELVKSLVNPGYISPDARSGEMTRFRDSFELYVKTRDLSQYYPGQQIELSERHDRLSTFGLHFRNNGPVDLHVYVYGLSSLWQIDHVHRATLDTVPAPPKFGEQSHDSPFDPFLMKKLRTMVPNSMRGFTHCDDVVKVFVTTHPTTFDVLEQPAYGIIEERAPTPRGDKVQEPVIEQWDAFNFPIRTALRRDTS